MRRILVESARRKGRLKHGGNWQRVSARDVATAPPAPIDEVLAVDETLEQLAEVDHQAAQVVKLHFFAGLKLEEVGAVLGISTRTAYRDWAFARAWLGRRLGQGDL